MDPVFVIPNKYPPSYIDYYKIINLSGLNKVNIKNVDHNNKNTYIYTMYPLIKCPDKKNRNSKTVLWYLERPSHYSNIDNFNKTICNICFNNNIDEVWFSDKIMMTLLKDVITKFVPIGTELGFENLNNNYNEEYDIIFLSKLTRRRASIINNIKNIYDISPNSYNHDLRDKYIKQSKFMLNIHKDNDKYIEPLRLAVAISYAIPYISETSYDLYPFCSNEIIECEYKDIKKVVFSVLKEPYQSHKERALKLRDRILKDFRFRNNVLMNTIGKI